jgi:HEAT repeat protein
MAMDRSWSWRPRVAPWIAALPLFLGPVLACSDRSDPGAAPQEVAAPAQPAKPSGPPPLSSITDPSLRADIEALEKVQGKEATIAAIEVLQVQTDPLSIPYIRPFIRHADPDVAEKAIEAIEFLAIATEDGIPVFSEALTWDLSPRLRKRLLQALYEQRTEIEDESSLARPMLGVLQRDPDPLVRIDAVEYAAAVGNVSIVPELQAQLDREKDDRVREAIEWSIRFLRNETTDPPPRFDVPS